MIKYERNANEVSVLGYLGYTSGFSLSCMVFFLVSVSLLTLGKQIYIYTKLHVFLLDCLLAET